MKQIWSNKVDTLMRSLCLFEKDVICCQQKAFENEQRDSLKPSNLNRKVAEKHCTVVKYKQNIAGIFTIVGKKLKLFGLIFLKNSVKPRF